MRFFQHFLRAWRDSVTSYTYDVLADTEEGWTEADRRHLLEFFGSETGRKLNTRLRNYVFLSAISATSQAHDTAHHTGIARGVRLAVNFLQEQMISASHPRSDDNSESEPSSSVEAELALQ